MARYKYTPVSSKGKEAIKLAIVIILGLLAIILIVPHLVNGQNIVSYQTMKEFDGYKQATLTLLKEHHTDCILARTIPVIEKAQYGFAKRKKNIQAWVNPTKDAQLPIIWINSVLEWSEDEAIVATVHEALHLALDKDGNFICGPDRYIRRVGYSKIPVCRPFGDEVYDSEQLKNAVALHLGKVTLAKKE